MSSVFYSPAFLIRRNPWFLHTLSRLNANSCSCSQVDVVNYSYKIKKISKKSVLPKCIWKKLSSSVPSHSLMMKFKSNWPFYLQTQRSDRWEKKTGHTSRVNLFNLYFFSRLSRRYKCKLETNVRNKHRISDALNFKLSTATKFLTSFSTFQTQKGFFNSPRILRPGPGSHYIEYPLSLAMVRNDPICNAEKESSNLFKEVKKKRSNESIL